MEQFSGRVAKLLGGLAVVVATSLGGVELAAAASMSRCSGAGLSCNDNGCAFYCKTFEPGTVGVCEGYYDLDWNWQCECQCHFDT